MNTELFEKFYRAIGGAGCPISGSCYECKWYEEKKWKRWKWTRTQGGDLITLPCRRNAASVALSTFLHRCGVKGYDTGVYRECKSYDIGESTLEGLKMSIRACADDTDFEKLDEGNDLATSICKEHCPRFPHECSPVCPFSMSDDAAMKYPKDCKEERGRMMGTCCAGTVVEVLEQLVKAARK